MSASIKFDNVKLLTYSHNHQFFGDNLNYSVQKSLVLEGCLYSLTNSSGVVDIWNQIVDVTSMATDYDYIILNGYNFGRGRINSINFVENSDVRKKEYSIDLTIFTTGNLYNMVGDDFIGVTLPNIHLTERFSESFDFNITEDGTFNYKQTINVQYIKGGVIVNPILAAKTLAAELFASSPAYGFIDAQHAGFYNQPGRRTYTETYNKITNDCSFSENFIQEESQGNYSLKYTQEVNTSEEGISTVIESGRIEGLLGPDFLQAALDGLAIELTQTFGRAVSLLEAYVLNPNPLNTPYLILQKKINQFTNSVDYVVQYDNDPRNQTTYLWEYTHEISRSNECFYQIKESGRIIGLALNCTKTQQYNNALVGWNVIKPGIEGRLLDYYEQVVNLDNLLVYISSSEKKAIHAGEISYDYTYTDDTTYNGTDPIKRTEIEIQENIPTHLIQRFAVANVGEISQDIGLIKQGERSANLRLLGRRGVVLNTYLAVAKTKLNTLIPTGEDIYIDGCSYNFSPTENNFDISVTWIYIGPAGGIFV